MNLLLAAAKATSDPSEWMLWICTLCVIAWLVVTVFLFLFGIEGENVVWILWSIIMFMIFAVPFIWWTHDVYSKSPR